MNQNPLDLASVFVAIFALYIAQPIAHAMGVYTAIIICAVAGSGLALVRAPVQVVHSGQRASHRRWSHLKWHVRSLLRLWRSPVYRQARQMLLEERQGAGNIGSS